jgi:streptogramin lyase
MRQRTLVVVLATVVVALTWSAVAEAAGSITSYTEGLSGTSPTRIVDGPDDNLWFTAGKDGFGDGTPMIGRVTPTGSVTTFSSGLDGQSSPYDIVVGPESNLWFTDSPVYGRGTAAIGRVTPSGTITEFTAAHDEEGDPIELSEPQDIVVGPEGNLWFTDSAYVGGEAAIGKITPAGVITEYRLPQYSLPTSIVVGPDNNLWFTNYSKVSLGTGSIGRITPSGTLSEFSSGLQSGGKPNDITVGPDGNLWFTETTNSSQGPAGIGRITTFGTITDFTSGLQSESHPDQIVSGPGGDLWFTDTGGFGQVEGEHPLTGEIGKITTAGTITEYGHDLTPGSITVGPDGNVWVGDYQRGLVRVTPAGQLTYFWLGLIEDGHSGIGDLVSGPGGSGVWFTDDGFTETGERTGVIGKVAPLGTGGTSPAPTVEVEEPDSGSGLVTSSPPGISCPGVCSSAFAPGTEVTLTATASPDSYLITPSLYMQDADPCPVVLPPVSLPSATCQFTVNGDALYRANFESFEEEEGEEAEGGSKPTTDGGGGGSGADGGGAQSNGPVSSPSTPKSNSVPPGSAPRHKAFKCRKGFRKEKVHGKAKCVKVKKTTKKRSR